MPIWEEILAQTKDTLESNLSARRETPLISSWRSCGLEVAREKSVRVSLPRLMPTQTRPG